MEFLYLLPRPKSSNTTGLSVLLGLRGLDFSTAAGEFTVEISQTSRNGLSFWSIFVLERVSNFLAFSITLEIAKNTL